MLNSDSYTTDSYDPRTPHFALKDLKEKFETQSMIRVIYPAKISISVIDKRIPNIKTSKKLPFLDLYGIRYQINMFYIISNASFIQFDI